ncbi:MAG: hypothetical protein K5776_02700 [Lachnospiraceae bacterium]|nr:hypothetical protein [Lachnospiraceae bacterium]
MEKFIKITSIGAVITYFLFILIGEWMGPFVFWIGNKNPGMTKAGAGIALYFGMTVFNLINAFLFVLFAALVILAIRNESTGIGVEITGLIIFLIANPVFNIYVKRLIFIIATRLIMNSDALAAYSLFTTGESFFSILSTISLGMMIIALTASICRKKWCPAENYNEG